MIMPTEVPRGPVANRFLFNFSSSYLGGGLKRLQEYAQWFNSHGGAWFIIHARCASLREIFPANRYFVVRQLRYRRIYDDTGYLRDISVEIGRPYLYYAYGIPIYHRVADVNWFHLSNLLPVYSRNVPLSLFDRLKLGYLGWRIRWHQHNADVISAESMFSLEKMRAADATKLFLSVNGSDDELKRSDVPAEEVDDIAVVVGTYRYKALNDAYRVFDMLRATNSELQLVVIGERAWMPRHLRHRDGVLVLGQLPRDKVVEYLSRARYYISTTLIENSYNAASEGVFLAAESYVSNIGPHREMLQTTKQELVSVPGVRRPVIHVRRADASADALKSWDRVITDMLVRVAELRGSNVSSLSASSR